MKVHDRCTFRGRNAILAPKEHMNVYLKMMQNEMPFEALPQNGHVKMAPNSTHDMYLTCDAVRKFFSFRYRLGASFTRIRGQIFHRRLIYRSEKKTRDLHETFNKNEQKTVRILIPNMQRHSNFGFNFIILTM